MKKYKVIIPITIALVVMLWAIARPYYVAGDCMEPGIKDGSYAYVNQISPFLRRHKIHDIITFDYEGKAWIARIVALERDTIQITEGSLILNGSVLSDSGIHRDWSDWKYGSYGIDNLLHVPADHVFCIVRQTICTS